MTRHAQHSPNGAMHAWSRFVAILLVGLLAGAGLGVALLEAAFSGPGSFYVAYKQLVITAYGIPLPVLAGGGILAGTAAAYLGRHDQHTFWLTFAAVVSVLVGMLITWIIHLPINDQLLDWHAEAPPGNWQQLQETWRNANLARTATAICGFVLFLIPLLRADELERGRLTPGH